jgi:hypothetical protein
MESRQHSRASPEEAWAQVQSSSVEAEAYFRHPRKSVYYLSILAHVKVRVPVALWPVGAEEEETPFLNEVLLPTRTLTNVGETFCLMRCLELRHCLAWAAEEQEHRQAVQSGVPREAE